ncbi:MAG: hypothetical protein JWR38_2088 [Mucilaginibacter sp.]|nr:hypothetical protein [Mucilaginibacter sp.]
MSQFNMFVSIGAACFQRRKQPTCKGYYLVSLVTVSEVPFSMPTISVLFKSWA